MEIRNEHGRLKTYDELYDEALDAVVEALDNLSDGDALDLGNRWRVDNGYNELYCNDSDNINDILGDALLEPYDLISMDYDEFADYFSWDGSEIGFTDDVWEDIDKEDFAREILDGGYSRDIPTDISDIVDAWQDANAGLESIPKGRIMAERTLERYLNNQADVGDLLVLLSRLSKEDELWEEN